MYRRLIAVLGAVLAVAAFGGLFLLKASAVGPSTWSDRAQVTGYAARAVRGDTSGAISVELSGVSAARIDEIVQGLPPANLRELCARNSQEYRISFSANAREIFRLTGYWCHNLVVEQPARGPAVDRIDRFCALLAEVRRLLPASATATHSGTCVRASGGLFLATSRHRVVRHPVPTHRVRKQPASKPPASKPPASKPPVVQHPVSKPPVTKHPVVRHPVTKHPVTKHPVVRRPVVKHPVVKHPVVKHRALKHRTLKHRILRHGVMRPVGSSRPAPKSPAR